MNRYSIPKGDCTTAEAYFAMVAALPWVYTNELPLYADFQNQIVDSPATLTGGLLLVPTPTELTILRNEALVKTDTDCDDIYFKVLGFRDIEYINAETEARAYKAAGYTGTVPALVAAYAYGSGTTAQQAADYTIALSDQWRPAMQAIRTYRTAAKTQLATVTNKQELDTAMAQWSGFVSSIKAQLGVS